MIVVKKEGVVLRKTVLDFECQGVLNPAIIKEGELVYMFYRAVSKNNYSTIGFCQLNGPLEVTQRFDLPVLIPMGEAESRGIEDPRIVKIDDCYYLTSDLYCF
ncbi:glycoside hydrolase family 130 protein [Pedobacter sp. NJ-S-72]